MSVRAYRIIKKELADGPSFNVWYDTKLLEFFEEEAGKLDGNYYDYRNEDGNGTIEISVPLLKRAVYSFPWTADDEYTLQAIKDDIAWAEKNNMDYVLYDCF